VDSMDKLLPQETGAIIPPQHNSSHRHTASRHRKEPARQQEVFSGSQEEVTAEADGGSVTCAYCENQLTLIHLSESIHQVKPYSPHLENQQELPGLFP
jgi:hypothetical protein